MALEPITMQMVKNIKDNGKMIKSMVMAFKNWALGSVIRVNTKMEKKKEKEKCVLRRVIMRDNLKIICFMGRVNYVGTIRYILELGKILRCQVR